MLRYLADGWRNLVTDPDLAPIRLNWEFFAVIEGSCAPRFVNPVGPVKLKQSTLWLLPPWAQYIWTGEDRPCLRAVFHVTHLPPIMTDHLPKEKFYETPLTETQAQHVLQLAKDFEPYYYHPDETYELHAMRLVSELCLLVLSPFTFKKENPLYHIALERVQKAEAYYRKNFKSSPGIEEVAAHTGVSASQLRRHFQRIRNTSPQLSFRSYRLQYACNLLFTNQTLDVVAEKAGFRSKRDFHRAFKENFGVTPDYWRKYANINTSYQPIKR